MSDGEGLPEGMGAATLLARLGSSWLGSVVSPIAHLRHLPFVGMEPR